MLYSKRRLPRRVADHRMSRLMRLACFNQHYRAIGRARRLAVTATVLALWSVAGGCSSYGYDYVLRVECEGRRVPGKVGEYVGLTPPVEVTIDCDRNEKRVEFDPMGQTQTIRFGESFRLMIDGGAVPRGFAVHVRRTGYKEWSATYYGDRLMQTAGGSEGGSFVRLDFVKLALRDSPEPSVDVSGGPEPIDPDNR